MVASRRKSEFDFECLQVAILTPTIARRPPRSFVRELRRAQASSFASARRSSIPGSSMATMKRIALAPAARVSYTGRDRRRSSGNRQVRCVADFRIPAELALEKIFFGDDGDGAGTGFGICRGLRCGIKVRLEHPFRGDAFLVCDDPHLLWFLQRFLRRYGLPSSPCSLQSPQAHHPRPPEAASAWLQ